MQKTITFTDNSASAAIILFILLFAFAQTSRADSGRSTDDSHQNTESGNPPVYIAFHWHMHQPIYWPYESIVETENRGSYSYSLRHDVMGARTGPYTDWPSNAVRMGDDADMPHFGAQVSFSGSLIENLEAAREAGWGFDNWVAPWEEAIQLQTEKGNPRLAMTGFGYHHPLMPLIGNEDIRRHIQWHREIMSEIFPGEYSKGIFPPETAFATRIIPALKDEGFEWVIVDNLHFERASEGAPLTDESGVKRPNKADVRNPNPGDWKQLHGLWAPTPVSTQWAHQPRYVSWTDPETGESSKMIAVPASRYLGEEDGRGGFGALQYEEVMSQFEEDNTDPDQPILLVLHHDGDNHGGGSEAYYNHNFQSMVEWLQDHPDRFRVTTIQDYLDRYPPDPDDVIHVQDGSWLGADGGDPEFLKWLADPGDFPGTDEPYSPNRNAWGVLTAARHIVNAADAADPDHPDTKRAWEYYLNGQSSDYWYWDGTEMWDSHPARAANLAVGKALPLAESADDVTGPAIFLPQREPYNPGGIEWEGQGVMPSDFEIWTFAFDLSGLESVKLKYRVSDSDEISGDNLTYDGGPSVGEWQSAEMSGTFTESITDPEPHYKAEEFRAEISGVEEQMVDYYVKATDVHGNTSKSIIQHVWVGEYSPDDDPANGAPDPDGPVTWEPAEPEPDEIVTITVRDADTTANLHWAVNNWTLPDEDFWPAETVAWDDGNAVHSPMSRTDEGDLEIQLGPFRHDDQEVTNISFVISYDDDSWDNNNGNDYFISIQRDVSADEPSQEALAFELKENYPNPFNNETVIPFSLDEDGHVSLTIYDVLGRKVAAPVDEMRSSGHYQVRFDASGLAGGTYVYRLESHGRVRTGTMMLLK